MVAQDLPQTVELASFPSISSSSDNVLHEISPGLYIGSFQGVQHELNKKIHKITHIISACAFLDTINLSEYTVLFLNILDIKEQNIIQYFPKAIEFIQNSFNSDPLNKVLIFCQAGISRSVTIASAYIMKTFKISKEEAISLIRKKQPNAMPNSGFMEQLQLFEDCNYTLTQETKKYRQWLFMHKTDLSLNNKTVPVASLYEQYNEAEDQLNIRCKKCGFILATSNYIIHYEPLLNKTYQPSIESPQCTHFFLEPLIWMKKELDNGNIEGKFNCPKCNSRIGKYAWQGMPCSCKKWVTPALTIQKGKIDLMKKNINKTVELYEF